MSCGFSELPGSREAAVRSPPFERVGNQLQQVAQCPGRIGAAQHEARQDGPDGGDGIGQIGQEAPFQPWRQASLCQIGEACHQIAQPGFGEEILTDGRGQHPGEMFDGQTALEHLETLLDAPATVVKVGKLASREGSAIQQGRDQEFLLARRQGDTDHANGKTGFPNLDPLCGSLAQGGDRRFDLEDGLGCARLKKARQLPHAGNAIAHSHAEVTLTFGEPGEQPIGRKATVKQQHVIGTNVCQTVRQHRAFTGARWPHVGMHEQTAGHVHETEHLGHRRLSAPAVAMNAKLVNHLGQTGQAQRCGITRQQSETMPAGHDDMLLPMIEQQVIERPKGRRQEFASSLREGAFGDRPNQVCLIDETAEEVIQFALQASRHATRQTGDDIGEGECAAACKIRRADPMGRNKFLSVERSPDSGHQRGMEVAKSSACILLKINHFAGHILPRTGLNLTALGLSLFLFPFFCFLFLF